MADMWREGDDWRGREARGWRDDDERRFGGRDYGYRAGIYPRYGDNPDWGRYYGEPGGYPADYGRPYGFGALGPGYMGYPSGRYGQGGYGYRGSDYWREPYRGRDWFEQAGDEVASWFGDEEAARRREFDRRRGHYGRGPRGYKRSDERITEDINDRLTDDWRLDASDIEVSVANGEVTLSGSVQSREDKRRAEDLAEAVSGVSDVHNNIRVTRAAEMGQGTSTEARREGGAGSRAH